MKKVLIYSVLAAILFLSFFVRIYRVNDNLGFYYDQGRDALVIWDLLNKGKLFLVGPTTGIAGILRGPFYYYLIAPFYFIGKGNPVYPSIFLAFTSIAAILLLFYLAKKKFGLITALIGVILASFSFNLVMASRWLSNPTPMLLLSMLLVWSMFLIIEKKKWAWNILFLTVGLSLFNFGSAAEVFYFPAIIIFAIWQRKNFPDNKNLLSSLILFSLTFLPLIAFDLKHQGILRNNIVKFFITDKSFTLPTWRFVQERLSFISDVFANKIFHGIYEKEKIILSFISLYFVYSLSRFIKKDEVKVLLLLIISPISGVIFFQGNFGNFYDYYFTGYYLIYILLFAIALGSMWKSIFGKIFVIFFYLSFFI